jgi:tetratricopeptide (TPR) repeat protein
MRRNFVIGTTMLLVAATVAAQSTRQELARGHAMWGQRLSKSAIEAFTSATRAKATAAEAYEMLGRIYMFKGWQQEGVFPGWHDEPEFREQALTALKAAVSADPNRTSAQEALRTAQGFAAADKVDPEPPRPEIKALDAKLESYRTARDAPIAEILDTIDQRTMAQADAAPYFTGAQILLDRGEYDRAIELAERGAAASDRFIDENLSAYKMTGKSQGAHMRGRATATDLVGWAAFRRKDLATATTKLEEAERLSRGQDFVNQFHLGELARAKNDQASAREHYLTALSLSGGPPSMRQQATETLRQTQPGSADAARFDGWLSGELTRRRNERRSAALKSLVDRPLPKLTLTTIDGRPYDFAGLRGKVLLLNFFSSW